MTTKQATTVTQEVRRRRIVDAAIDCLCRDGWHRTTMAAIAKEAGISRGLISYHFAGRDDLYEAVLESVVSVIFGEGAAAIEPRIASAGTAMDMLQSYIEENLRFIGSHRREMTALTEVMPNLRAKDGTPRFGPDAEEPIIAGTAAMFEYGMATGEFRPIDSRILASALRRCIDGAAQQIVTDPDFDIDACAQQLTELFQRGVSS